MHSLVIGAVLGLIVGVAPGPFSALVVTTALERDRRSGMKVALVPLVTELPALFAGVFLLTQLPEEGLRWVGIAGGGLLMYIAWRVLRNAGEATRGSQGEKGVPGRFLQVALVGLMSPTPWAFWFLLGGPIVVNRWYEGPLHAVVFVAAFLVCFVGVLLVEAWGAGSGGRKLSSTWYRRALRGAGGFLVVVAVVLIWQSWVGNFSELVQAPEEIQDELR